MLRGLDRGLRDFGVLADGTPVRACVLGRPDGLMAEVLTLGATLRRLSVPTPDGRRDVVLALPDVAAYEADPAFLGQLVGRVANRIGGARFMLDGRDHRVTANEGPNQLHGGRHGFGRKVWRVAAHHQGGEGDSLRLELTSPDGEEGFPATLDVAAVITVGADTLTLEMTARADAPTPLNLTWHPYFNLAGLDPAAEILTAGGSATGKAAAAPVVPAAAQWLSVAADQVLVVDEHLIPTGGLLDVAGTVFDFRAPRPLSDEGALAATRGYDHCYRLRGGDGPAAVLRSPDSGITMTVETDQPGMQVYGGQWLPGVPGAALCLEPQDLPDAINRPEFPSVVLRPGARWRRFIRYHLTHGNS